MNPHDLTQSEGSRSGIGQHRPNLRTPLLSLPSVILLPTRAASIPIDSGPRHLRRAAGGPPLLSGCLPAPSDDGES
jgi:hypothetical protein